MKLVVGACVLELRDVAAGVAGGVVVAVASTDGGGAVAGGSSPQLAAAQDMTMTTATRTRVTGSMSAQRSRSGAIRHVGTVGGVNRLADETSPYLRQHRDNPVDWYPWGDEAFAAAEDATSRSCCRSGYSACHWCHVMAHECFEDAEVAAAMNELFVNVKVDREERPDVDALYMDAVQALTGRGGWPMTVVMTPDGARSSAARTSPRRRSCS